MSKVLKAVASLLLVSLLLPAALAEEQLESLSGAAAAPAKAEQGISKFELESQLSQIRSELRAQRDIADMRTNAVETKIDLESSSLQRQLISFMLAVGIVAFVVLLTMNKQTNVNNERMRGLIREADQALDELHRLIDRPDTEHFNVSRRLGRVMNKFRERANPSLPQKDITDVYAAADDPTLPVSLHLQANALRCELQGKYADSIMLWEKLLGIDDTSPEVMLHLAQNYKRLAETSSGQQASRYSSFAMDYFQKYSVRTNIHSHSERELRKMGVLGELADSPSNLAHQGGAQPPGMQPVQQSLEEEQPAPEARKARLAKPELKVQGVARTLLDLAPKPKQAPPAPSPSQVKPTPEPAAQPMQEASAPDGKDGKGVEPGKQAPAVEAKQAPEPKTSAERKAKASKPPPQPKQVATKARAKPAAAKAKSSVIKRPAVAANGASKPKPRPKAKATAAQVAIGAAGNGAKKELTPTQADAAFKSRSEKALDYFTRYAKATSKGDKLQWLKAAADEYAAAEKYKQDKEVYRMWGITLLEIAGVDTDNSQEHVTVAARLFTRANQTHNGAFCNELALCYAMIDNEPECRKALEAASKQNLLDADIYRGQPSFDKYKQRPWYQELAAK